VRREKTTLALAAILAASSSACSGPQAAGVASMGERPVQPVLFRMDGRRVVDGSGLCPGARTPDVSGPANTSTSLVGWLTLGLYAPRRLTVGCPSGTGEPVTWEIDLDDQDRPVRVLRQDGPHRSGGTPIPRDRATGTWSVVLHDE
jgi:hypothetical protein